MHDNPGARASNPSTESPQPSTGAAEMPGLVGRALEDHSSPAGSEGGTRPGPDVDAVDAVASEAPKTRARVLRRLMILLGLVLVGVSAGVWAIALFPKRPTIINPTPLNIFLGGDWGASRILLYISPSSARSVEVTVGLSPIALPGTDEELNLYIDIPGEFSVSCPSPVTCQQGQNETSIQMSFMPPSSGNPPDQSLTIKDPQISATSNGLSAIAELPAVTGLGGSGSSIVQPQLFISYYAPNADTYDWSMAPLTAGRRDVIFREPLSTTLSAQTSEITGTNHQAQDQDDRDTFVAGILLGVAGGAAIAAIQEGLHMMFDDRDDNRPSKLARPSKAVN